MADDQIAAPQTLANVGKDTRRLFHVKLDFA
jgi:hypothetical protein